MTLSDFPPEIPAEERKVLDSILEDAAKAACARIRGTFSRENAGEFPGFRLHFLLDRAEEAGEIFRGRPDFGAIMARLGRERDELHSLMLEDFRGERDLAETEVPDEGSIPIELMEDWCSYRDFRMAEEGGACLDVRIRGDITEAEPRLALVARISFAPYYDFNHPLLEKALPEGDPAGAVRRILKEEFPAVADRAERAPRP